MEAQHRLLNLIHLYSAIDEQSNVVDHQTNDLNGVLETECIPDKEQLVEEPEDIEGEEGRYGSGVNVVHGARFEIELKRCKDVAIASISIGHWQGEKSHHSKASTTAA